MLQNGLKLIPLPSKCMKILSFTELYESIISVQKMFFIGNLQKQLILGIAAYNFFIYFIINFSLAKSKQCMDLGKKEQLVLFI